MKPRCDDCDHAQASHTSLWLANTNDVLMLYLPSVAGSTNSPLYWLAEHIVEALAHVFYHLGRLAGCITFNDNPANAASKRTELVWNEARRRGIPMRELVIFGKPTDHFITTVNGRTFFFESMPLPTDARGVSVAVDDKISFKRLMKKHGLPVPESRGVWSLRGAQQAQREFGLVCVKPRSGSNGRHTFPFVRHEQDLRDAYASASKLCASVSVEEHLEGNLCRATCVDGILVGFLESSYPTVIGDGVSSVAELVRRANAEKPDGVDDIVLSSSHRGYMHRRGYRAEDVLPDGEPLPLTYRAGRGQGGRNREHGRDIHPSFIPLIEKAAQATGLPIVGFDIIIPDPLAPADSQRWGFIEANSFPWADLHAHALYGKAVDLAPHLWDLWTGRGTARGS